MAINHQHLRAFNAVATERSFSRAARRMNISQPTLSQQIKSLEGRYGQILFESRRSPLELTPVGQALYEKTRQIFDVSDEIEALLRDQFGAGRNRIRIVADSPTHVAQLASAMLDLDSQATIEIDIANSAETLTHLLNAHADLAVASDPRIDERLSYTPLFVDRLHMLVAADHPRAGQRSFPLASLVGERLLMREPSSKTRAALQSLLDATGIQPANLQFVYSREAIREAVALGMGVSPMFSSECPPDSRLVGLPIDRQPSSTILTGYLICRTEQRRSGLMRWVNAAAAFVGGEVHGTQAVTEGLPSRADCEESC
ncbi:MAG TPA: LysR substrate-binding domain-containing protein [Novosphingobium sp.]